MSFQLNNKEQNTSIMQCLYNASSPPPGAKSPIENHLRELQETWESKLYQRGRAVCDCARRQGIHGIWVNFPILLQTSCKTLGKLPALCSVPTCNTEIPAPLACLCPL